MCTKPDTDSSLANIYLFKYNNGNTRTMLKSVNQRWPRKYQNDVNENWLYFIDKMLNLFQQLKSKTISVFLNTFNKFSKAVVKYTFIFTALFRICSYMEGCLKVVSTIFYQICIFSANDSPLKTMENVFYFI